MKALTTTIIATLILSVLIGCKSRTPQYIPLETTNTSKDIEKSKAKDSIRIIEKTIIKDSVRIKDSIVYKVNEKGDVIGKEVYQWKDRYRENNYLLTQLQVKYDSLLQVKQDSIRIEVAVPVNVPVPYYPKWIIVLACLGGVFIGYIGYRLYFTIRKLCF